MLVTFQVAVLDPKEDRVEGNGHDNHDGYQLQLRVVADSHEVHGVVTEVKDLLIHRDLLEEDYNFTNENAAGPDKHLQKPYSEVDLAVWVTFGKRDFF